MGLTALHLAAWEADDGPQIVQLLLLCGADKDIKDIEGMTAADRARSRNRGLCEDCIVDDNITPEERESYRAYLDKELKVQPQKGRMASHPRLSSFDVPVRLPVLPRELEVPEQFILPYATNNFKASRGPEPLRNIGWAKEQIEANEGRRRLLRDSVDRKIALYTGIGKDTPQPSRPSSAVDQAEDASVAIAVTGAAGGAEGGTEALATSTVPPSETGAAALL